MNYDEIILYKSLVFKHMSKILLFEGYLRRTTKYQERIILYDLTHITSMADPMALV